MPTLNVVGRRVEASQDEHDKLQQRFDVKVETHAAVQIGATRGADALLQLEVEDGDLIELAYDNGLHEWTTARELVERYASTSRSGGDADSVTITPFPPQAGATRGLKVDMVLKGLKLLGVDPTDAIASGGVQEAIRHFESQLEPGPGLYRLNRKGELTDLISGELPASEEPYLLLLHGTFSSTDGSFHQLFTSREWAELWGQYDGRVYGFNHRTLSQSPIENTLELIGHLPKEATLHLLSHSRGGLIGELLCLSAVGPEDERCFDPTKRAHDIDTLRKLSEQLVTKQLKVWRFVRVACPTRGTLLVSESLDRYLSVILNLIGLIPALANSIIYDFAKATILTLIKKRADPNMLPGLEAMMPESPLVAMLNREGGRSSSDLAVVAGDIMPGGGVWNTLKAWASDAFYWQEHDLVVHTKAMYGGLARPDTAMYYFRAAPDMNHFNYFSNDESRNQVYRWLTQKPGKWPEGFHSLARVRGPARSRTREALPADSPVVILIPGVFASHLKVRNERIWVDLASLAAGSFERLAFDNADVQPDGIVDEHFAELIDFLAQRFDVIEFAYDWRKSLSGEAKQLSIEVEKALADNRKVYLLAHSSGGLLGRALMAYHESTWNKLVQQGGRLVMLGAPSHGSYAMLELLSGQAELARMLGLLDRQRTLDEIGQQFRRYPGLVELLPHGQGHDEWKSTFLATLADDEKERFERLLAAAVRVWKKLNDAVAPKHMCYVAGKAAATVSHAQASEAQQPLSLLETSAGDGFVTAELALLPGVPTWYMDAAHGDLASTTKYFGALAELLVDGTTMRLKKEAPQVVESSVPVLRRARPVLYPNRSEFVAAATSGTPPEPISIDQDPAVTLRLSVLHASLEHASYPLAIGHYDGDTIVGAEAALDIKLDGRLSQRRLMNLYPGKVNTVEVILSPHTHSRSEVEGALVIGLGEIGQISPEIVSKGVTEAALRLALAKLDAGGLGGDPAEKPVSAAFSTLLIGTRGWRTLSIESAVAAIVTGAMMANRALAERELLDKVSVDAVEFVEIYGDLAIRATHAINDLERYLRITRTSSEIIEPQQCLQQGEGAYVGQPPSAYDAGWWQRIQIKEAAASLGGRRGGELQFLQLTDRARAESTLQATQRSLVDLLVDKTIHEPTPDLDLPATLYELLIPNDLKNQPLESTNLLLVLDSQAAQYPWEMLAERRVGTVDIGGEPLQPLAVRTGMVRQLETPNFRAQVQAPRGKNALVIGEPRLDDPNYPPLPGARNEAEAVAKVLELHQYKVTKLIGEDPLKIVNALYAKEYRIIHIAGHGIYQPNNPQQSGVVLGKDIYLTAAEIGQLRVVPELVFLNCCYLGRIDSGALASPNVSQSASTAWNKLAASVSEKLIQIGVRAVVAAGWAVDDRSASTFAETLYDNMLSGKVAQFGDAVRNARHNIYENDPGSNTWGAYQCYGDPGYVLQVGEAQHAAAQKKFVAPEEIKLELTNLRSRASRTTDKKWITRYIDDLHSLEARIHDIQPRWRNGEMLTDLGDAYAEFGDFEDAILCYREALGASSPSERVPIRAIEQLANLEARFAVRLSLGETKVQTNVQTNGLAPSWNVDKLMEEAERLLTSLITLAPTRERYALLGSYYKRRALTNRSNAAQRNEALEKAECNYKLALDLAGPADESYHYLNQLVCRYLNDTPFDDGDHAQIEIKLKAIEARIPKGAGLGFWDRIATADIALLRSLIKSAQNQVEADDQMVFRSYKRELDRGATARQRSTVLEHMQFVAEILKVRGQDQAAEILEELRKSLENEHI